jgi:tol-pal system protein YbgF
MVQITGSQNTDISATLSIMKKTILNFLLVVALVPFLSQCASQSDVEDIRYQLRIVNKKLEDMKSTTFGQLQKRQAASAGQMDELGLQVLELKSQLDETGHTNRRLKEQNKELKQSIDTIAATEAGEREVILRQFEEGQKAKEEELHLLNEQLQIQRKNVKAIQEARIRDAELKAQAARRAVEAAKVKARTANAATLSRPGTTRILADKKKIKFNTSVTSRSTTSIQITPVSVATQKTTPNKTTGASTPKNTASANKMAQAQKLFDKNKLNEALELFEQIAATPSSGNAVNARYMMGECLFNQKEYDRAIMQYQKIISQHPGNEKAPTAMLRQGLAFEKLSDKATAKVIYKKLLKRHGSSPEAEKAKEKLSKL